VHYFVTGSTGFIGGYVTALLLAEGHAVTTLVASREEARALAPYGVRPHIGDLTDKASMRRGMLGADGVFHLAEWRRLGARNDRVAEAVNVTGTRNVLELMRDLQIPKGVYLSSLLAHGDTGGRIVDETYRPTGRPLSVYGRTKREAHFDVALPMMLRGLPLVVLQPGLVYGPGEDGDLGRLIRSYVLGRVPLVPTGSVHCWAHVEDVATAHVMAMESGDPGETFIVGGPHHTLREVLVTAGRLIGRKRGPLPVPGVLLRPAASVLSGLGWLVPPLRIPAERLRAVAGATYLGDSSKAARRLGFRPRPIKEGLPDVVRGLLQELFEP
jgi:nucleoside-diphosphate-sugar epimerase